MSTDAQRAASLVQYQLGRRPCFRHEPDTVIVTYTESSFDKWSRDELVRQLVVLLNARNGPLDSVQGLARENMRLRAKLASRSAGVAVGVSGGDGGVAVGGAVDEDPLAETDLLRLYRHFQERTRHRLPPSRVLPKASVYSVDEIKSKFSPSDCAEALKKAYDRTDVLDAQLDDTVETIRQLRQERVAMQSVIRDLQADKAQLETSNQALRTQMLSAATARATGRAGNPRVLSLRSTATAAIPPPPSPSASVDESLTTQLRMAEQQVAALTVQLSSAKPLPVPSAPCPPCPPADCTAQETRVQQTEREACARDKLTLQASISDPIRKLLPVALNSFLGNVYKSMLHAVYGWAVRAPDDASDDKRSVSLKAIYRTLRGDKAVPPGLSAVISVAAFPDRVAQEDLGENWESVSEKRLQASADAFAAAVEDMLQLHRFLVIEILGPLKAPVDYGALGTLSPSLLNALRLYRAALALPSTKFAPTLKVPMLTAADVPTASAAALGLTLPDKSLIKSGKVAGRGAINRRRPSWTVSHHHHKPSSRLVGSLPFEN